MGELPLQNLHKGGSSIDANYLQELIDSNRGAKQHGSRSEQLEPTRNKNKTKGASGNEYQQARS
mgnify:CR=1 FL=1